MLKVYTKYIIYNFLRKFLKVTFIFISLTYILGILEEINFFKETKSGFFLPYFLTFLNLPITLFEMFPFIIFISTQFFLHDMLKRDELDLLKKNGLRNINLVKTLFLISICLGLFNITVYYNISSKLKFYYSDIKNKFSKDNKYLAMVTENGLWIKDEVKDKKYIIKSKFIKENFLSETIINEFNSDFILIRSIKADLIDIKNNNWIIFNPVITFENNSSTEHQTINILTNFDSKKINNLFTNISSLNLIKLHELKKDFNKLGYSSDEIDIHLIKIYTSPLFYGVISIFAVVIILNLSKNKSLIFHLISGIMVCVLIYYANFVFNSLGNAGKIPVVTSVFFPLAIIFLSSIIGLVNIDEK